MHPLIENLRPPIEKKKAVAFCLLRQNGPMLFCHLVAKNRLVLNAILPPVLE